MSKLSVKIDGRTFAVEINSILADGSPFEVEVDGEKLVVLVPQGGDSGMVDWLLVDGRPYEIVLDADMGWMSSRTGRHSLEIRDMAMAVPRSVSGDGRIKAPIPGVITRLLVKEGEEVGVGQALMILEAMKMENEIRAPRSGFVNSIWAEPGVTVGMGELLAEVV